MFQRGETIMRIKSMMKGMLTVVMAMSMAACSGAPAADQTSSESPSPAQTESTAATEQETIVTEVSAETQTQEETAKAPKYVFCSESNGIVSVTINWKFKYGKLSTIYEFGKDGINLSLNIKPYCNLIRYGFKFGTRKEIKEMRFYAKGPFENYCDRSTGAILREYQGEAEDFNHEYLSPQENGNHTQARYLDLGTEDNGFIALAIDKPFEFGVLPYTMEKLENAKHSHELIKDDYYSVTIDGKQRGVGGDIPAMACLKPQYKILARKTHNLKFRLIVK